MYIGDDLSQNHYRDYRESLKKAEEDSYRDIMRDFQRRFPGDYHPYQDNPVNPLTNHLRYFGNSHNQIAGVNMLKKEFIKVTMKEEGIKLLIRICDITRVVEDATKQEVYVVYFDSVSDTESEILVTDKFEEICTQLY